MAKKVSLEGKKIASVVKIGKAEIIHFTDGTFIIVDMLSDNLSSEDAGFEASAAEEDDEEEEEEEDEDEEDEDEDEDEDDEDEEEDEDDEEEDEEDEDEEEEDEDDDEDGDEEDEDEDEDDDEDGEVSIDEMKEALLENKIVAKKKLAKMSDEEIQEMYDEELGDEEEEEDEDEEEEDDEDDTITASELKAADFDDLEDIIDDNKLKIDIEDYTEKTVEKLRKAVAKALKIKL